MMSTGTECCKDERWASVTGHGGLYEVSTCGRVRSLERTLTTKATRRSRAYNRTFQGRLLKHRLGAGRPNITLQVAHGERTTVGVCRLVLLAFRGTPPDGMEACHFPDKDPTNNHLSNLQWNTHQINLSLHRDLQGTSPKGEANPGAKITEVQAREILAQRGASAKQLADEYGLHPASIYAIWSGNTWGHLAEV